MSHCVCDTPRPFQPSITQRDIEAEVAHCVGDVITPLLYDVTLDHVLDVPARPVEQPAAWAARANAHCDEARYALAGKDLGTLLTELHVQAATGMPAVRRTALAALIEACAVAFGIARQLGHPQLAVQAMDRGLAAAERLGDPALAGFAGLARAGAFSRLGARRTAAAVLSQARAAVEPEADPTAGDVRAAEALGMTHLLAAQLAGRDGRVGDADTHLAEAASLAAVTGERNTLAWHFGPANVAAWSLSIAVERGDGPGHAERLDADPVTPVSAGKRSRLHLDLARGYAQAEGSRDSEAIRHLDTADRIAPTRVRNDPIARDLVLTLDRRARRRVWELDSLRNRFAVSRSVKG
jgi:hypothetical protein